MLFGPPKFILYTVKRSALKSPPIFLTRTTANSGITARARSRDMRVRSSSSWWYVDRRQLFAMKSEGLEREASGRQTPTESPLCKGLVTMRTVNESVGNSVNTHWSLLFPEMFLTVKQSSDSFIPVVWLFEEKLHCPAYTYRACLIVVYSWEDIRRI